MFESLVIVTREGVEAALVVAIVLASLRRTGRMSLAPWVYGGVGAAVALSALGAWLLPSLIADAEIVEGWALTAGAVCVIGLVIWMQSTGKKMKGEIESGMERLDGGDTGAAATWGLAGFTAVLIFREGFETVLFLTAISFNTQGLERLFGALGGLALAVFFGVLFVRGTLRVPIARFFTVTTVVLVVLAVQLLVGAYHEFAELGWLPANRTSMSVVGPLVRYDSLLFAAAVLLTLFLIRDRRAGAPAAEAATPAERRKLVSRERRERLARRATAVSVASVSAILLTGFLSQSQVPAKQDGAPAPIAGGSVRVPLEGLDEGVHYFQTPVDGRAVRWFVTERAAGELVACFDACRICGDLGYYEEAGGVTCRNCTAPVNPASLGRDGGCNPIPLASRVEDGALVIDATALEGGAHYFAAAP